MVGGKLVEERPSRSSRSGQTAWPDGRERDQKARSGLRHGDQGEASDVAGTSVGMRSESDFWI